METYTLLEDLTDPATGEVIRQGLLTEETLLYVMAICATTGQDVTELVVIGEALAL